MQRLAGKITLVTGAARGIGAAIARAFVAEGATVYVTDINDSLGEAVAAALGEHATYVHLDVREESHWQAVTARILAERGALHVVVNNAGITGFEEGIVPHDPEHASLADWHKVHRAVLQTWISNQ